MSTYRSTFILIPRGSATTAVPTGHRTACQRDPILPASVTRFWTYAVPFFAYLAKNKIQRQRQTLPAPEELCGSGLHGGVRVADGGACAWERAGRDLFVRKSWLAPRELTETPAHSASDGAGGWQHKVLRSQPALMRVHHPERAAASRSESHACIPTTPASAAQGFSGKRSAAIIC